MRQINLVLITLILVTIVIILALLIYYPEEKSYAVIFLVLCLVESHLLIIHCFCCPTEKVEDNPAFSEETCDLENGNFLDQNFDDSFDKESSRYKDYLNKYRVTQQAQNRSEISDNGQDKRVSFLAEVVITVYHTDNPTRPYGYSRYGSRAMRKLAQYVKQKLDQEELDIYVSDDDTYISDNYGNYNFQPANTSLPCQSCRV